MTNAVSGISSNSIMELLTCDDEASCSDFTGFDVMLSNLLSDGEFTKDTNELSKEKLSVLYAGLFGGVIPSASDVSPVQDESTDLAITFQKEVPLQPSIEKAQLILNNIADIISTDNGDGIISVEEFSSLFENIIKTENLTENQAEQLKAVIHNLIDEKYSPNTVVDETGSASDTKKVDISLNESQGNIVTDSEVLKSAEVKLDEPDVIVRAAQQPNQILQSENKVVNRSENKTAETDMDSDNSNSSFTGIENVRIVSDKNENGDTAGSADKNNEFNFENEFKDVKKVFEFNVFNTAENIGENSVDTLISKADALTEVVKNHIVETAEFTQQNGKQEFQIQLNPNFLGKILIKLEKNADGMNIRILTSNPNVKEILTGQSLEMIDAIKNQGVELNNVEVVYTGLSNSNRDLPNNGKYKIPNKKSISQAKEEFEQAIVGGMVGSVNMPMNYNGSVNYLA